MSEMPSDTSADMSSETRHRHDHLSVLSDRAREAGLDDVAAIYTREAAALRGETIEDGTTVATTSPTTEPKPGPMGGDPHPAALVLCEIDATPNDAIAVHCPGCIEQLERLSDDDARSFSGRCERCDVAHSSITCVGVPITEDGSSVDVDAKTCRRALDQFWTERAQNEAIAGELERAGILSQFWSKRSDTLGWVWTPPASLYLGDIGDLGGD